MEGSIRPALRGTALALVDLSAGGLLLADERLAGVGLDPSLALSEIWPPCIAELTSNGLDADAGRGKGSLEAGSPERTAAKSGFSPSFALRQAWMSFCPSPSVSSSAAPTNGWNLAVVNVYTRPVSDTTSKRTCVPVNVASSYACTSV